MASGEEIRASESAPRLGDPNLRPTVVALVGSPRRGGNTAFAAGIATQELERRGILCETVMLSDLALCPCGIDPGPRDTTAAEDGVEPLLDRVWAADGLILATPVHFCNVSAQMKAFMDRTNDRYLSRQWLTPKVIGLLVIGGQGGFADTVAALRRYLDFVAPSRPPVEVAAGHADACGEAQQSTDLSASVQALARRMSDILLG
jgi:NAD(P)H-dependent FMN reductase